MVSVVSQEVPPGMPERRVNGCRFNHIQGDPSSWKSFQKAGMAEADSILLGGWALAGAVCLVQADCMSSDAVLPPDRLGKARGATLRHGLISIV